MLEVQEARCLPARELANLIIEDYIYVLDPVTRLMTRNLYAALNCRLVWSHRLTLSDQASQEVDLWLSEISDFNGRHMWLKPSTVKVAYSDASVTGCGGYVVEHRNLVSNGQWSPDEAKQNSTWKRLG